MSKSINYLICFILITGLLSCNVQGSDDARDNSDNGPNAVATAMEEPALKDDVITAKEQKALTPQGVISGLMEGNKRYMNDNLTPRDLTEQMKKTADGQFPEAIILSCVDSRVPVEYIFDRGIGDLFVARVAGNFANTDILGSMEFACKVSGSKVILVMGHESCGAVKATIDDVKLGNITPMLASIEPAESKVSYPGERSSKNKEYLNMVIESNVEYTMDQIRAQSPILKEMEENGEIMIVGAVYDLDTGKVKMLEE